MTIRNDATRLRIDAREKRRSRAVVSRQGQVLMDTDFDQQTAALLGRIETEAADVFDSAGRLVYPAGTTGFQISAAGGAGNFDIGIGRGYLDGWLLENMATAKLSTQPHPRSPADTVSPPAIIGLKALVRFIDPVEDPALADVALGDAKASGRALVDWQVFPLSGVGADTNCANAPIWPEWTNLTAPSAGTMSVIKQAAGASADPCSLSPGGGYTRLENLLYRVEVHGGVPKPGFPVVDGPRFGLDGLRVKFSRINASLMARIVQRNGVQVTVEPASLDSRAWFTPGAWAEFVNVHDDVDPRAALNNQRLFRVAIASDDVITFEVADATAVNQTGVATDGNWFLRLWDAFAGSGDGFTTIAGTTNSQLIDLGDGLSIKFHNGSAATFRRGDYWTFAARADGTVAWPETAPGVPAQLTPHGPETRYTVLATVIPGPAGPVFENCSIPSFSLTDRFLFYRGGDGQSVFAGKTAPAFVPLPQKLRVAVMRGQHPVKGAIVRWQVPATFPDTQIATQLCTAAVPRTSVTDADGLAEVEWAIARAHPLAVHKVQATLELAPGSPAKNLPDPIVFNATFETAAHTAYVPDDCEHLKGVDNVQEALATLCKKIDAKPPALTLKQIRLLGAGAPVELIRENLILNGLGDVSPDAFISGIRFDFEGDVANIEILPFDPVVEVELDLPYPTTDPDRIYWASASARIVPTTGQPVASITGMFGFQRMRLDGVVTRAAGPGGQAAGLIWQPSQQAVQFLTSAAAHRFGQRIIDTRTLTSVNWRGPDFQQILCRIGLRAPMIWTGQGRQRAYLNAEHLGTNGTPTKRELLLDTRDAQAAANLDMFIYLKLPPVRQGPGDIRDFPIDIRDLPIDVRNIPIDIRNIPIPTPIPIPGPLPIDIRVNPAPPNRLVGGVAGKAGAKAKPAAKPNATAAAKPAAKPKATAAAQPAAKPKATAAAKPAANPKATVAKPAAKAKAAAKAKPGPKPTGKGKPAR